MVCCKKYLHYITVKAFSKSLIKKQATMVVCLSLSTHKFKACFLSYCNIFDLFNFEYNNLFIKITKQIRQANSKVLKLLLNIISAIVGVNMKNCGRERLEEWSEGASNKDQGTY